MRITTLTVYEHGDTLPPSIFGKDSWGRVALLTDDGRVLLARPLTPEMRPDLYSDREKARRVYQLLSSNPVGIIDVEWFRESLVWEAADHTYHAGIRRIVVAEEPIASVLFDEESNG